MSKGAYLKLCQRVELTPDPPFVGNVLRDLFTEVFGNSRALPDDAWFRKSCGTLNYMHGWFYAAQEDRKRQQRHEATQKAKAKLIGLLQEGRADLPWLEARVAPLPTMKNADRLYDRSIEHAKAIDIPRPPEAPRGVNDYRWFDEVLRAEIDKAMQGANSDYPVDQAKGQTTEVLARIARMVTGATMLTTVAVATQRQKNRRRPGRDSQNP